MRFYDRQFITREHVNRDVLTEFERLLDSYFEGDKPQEQGLPYVQINCILCLSTFGISRLSFSLS